MTRIAPKALVQPKTELETSHSAFAGTYVIEGHVPAASIRRLLGEKPSLSSLIAPGMPMGSPGMANAVLAISDNGNTTVYARYL